MFFPQALDLHHHGGAEPGTRTHDYAPHHRHCPKRQTQNHAVLHSLFLSTVAMLITGLTRELGYCIAITRHTTSTIQKLPMLAHTALYSLLPWVLATLVPGSAPPEDEVRIPIRKYLNQRNRHCCRPPPGSSSTPAHNKGSNACLSRAGTSTAGTITARTPLPCPYDDPLAGSARNTSRGLSCRCSHLFSKRQ